MKKIASIIALVGLLAVPALAADKEITVTGLGQCAKCALHETDKCQNTIQTEEHGKKVTYYLAENDVSKDFHDNICKKSEKITATGVVSQKDGKKILTVSKIKEAK
jgi:predicted hydrolase (HD superfamily)